MPDRLFIVPEAALSDRVVTGLLSQLEFALEPFGGMGEQPAGEPASAPSAQDAPHASEPSPIPDGPGPFGPCPRDGCPGVVKRWYHKDGVSNHLSCSERRFKDANSCDFAAWDEDEQRAYFAGQKLHVVVTKTVEEPVEAIEKQGATPVVLASKIHEELRKATPTKRNRTLKPYGWDGKSSYVLFVDAMATSQPERLVSLANDLGID